MRKFVGFAADDIEKFEWLPSGSLKAQIDEKKFSKLYLPQSIFADFFAHKFKESNVMYIWKQEEVFDSSVKPWIKVKQKWVSLNALQ